MRAPSEVHIGLRSRVAPLGLWCVDELVSSKWRIDAEWFHVADRIVSIALEERRQPTRYRNSVDVDARLWHESVARSIPMVAATKGFDYCMVLAHQHQRW